MLKFHEIVLRKILLVLGILFIVLGSLIYFWIKDFYISQTREALLNNIKIISLNLKNKPNLDRIATNIKNDLGLRLTIISLDGVVVAESHKDKTKLDNHKYRAEIMEADKDKYGSIIRHSNSIEKDFLYVAKKYKYDDKFFYIRVSKALESINEKIYILGAEILFTLAIFFIIIFIITYKISTSIEREFQKIATFLSSLTKKNKNTYITSTLSLEFQSITSLLTKVSQILVKKEKQKSKFTDKLQSSNKQKDDIISAISHEFKNPIAVINGYSQTLMDDEDINPNIRKKFLSKIYNNGIKLSELIDTLRLSSKLDSGQQAMHFKTTNLYELINDSVENIRLSYNNREVIISGDKDIVIKVDASLFSVVITNLVENAFKYSEDEVHIEFTQESLKIIDSGIGISQKNLLNITEKFYRVHENSWNNSLGLGLFIVSNILNLHHFKLGITSKENEGSTFSIKF
ncbi:HAMP domain-containing sensor histidine kinase [Sulfurimonas sp.]|uniref:sensor histidine kinase n=1 Tax=Sulfurimonas sp. TaxID=2022749 RepID=UPI0025DEC350|nr:HAMP domain-containing sensor histidine kinase [Sulfurimonas sp.]MBT5933812.1 HAMP domain-containing histidine kinase [Sulfurimonas sp.]